MSKSLTADLFDRIAEPRPAGRQRIVWTAEAIGARIGTSADFVRETLVHIDGSPVKKIGNRYCAHEDDLIAFFRTPQRNQV